VKCIFVTILGIAVIAGAAILIGRAFLDPAQEEAESKRKVLTGAYAPRLEEMRELDDSELPGELEPPGVGEDIAYVLVVVLYPGVSLAPDPAGYEIEDVNGDPDIVLVPVHAAEEEDEEGTYVSLTFRTDRGFLHGRLVHDGKVVVEQLRLE